MFDDDYDDYDNNVYVAKIIMITAFHFANYLIGFA